MPILIKYYVFNFFLMNDKILQERNIKIKNIMNMIKIRESKEKDIDRIMEIYTYAKKFMKESGNPNQWNGSYPEKELILQDISKKNFYVGYDENNEIHLVFAFIIGKDECYENINGSWLNDEEYGTIHRIASDGKIKGCFKICLDFCKEKVSNLRADTHEDNKIMQHLLEKYNFQKCGIIISRDNTERIAYHYIREE